MQGGQLHPDPVCLGQSSGEFLERDVRLGPDDLQQKRLVPCQLAGSPWRSALRLGADIAMLPPGRSQPHRCARTHTPGTIV